MLVLMFIALVCACFGWLHPAWWQRIFALYLVVTAANLLLRGEVMWAIPFALVGAWFLYRLTRKGRRQQTS